MARPGRKTWVGEDGAPFPHNEKIITALPDVAVTAKSVLMTDKVSDDSRRANRIVAFFMAVIYFCYFDTDAE